MNYLLQYLHRGRHRTGEFATDLVERIRSELGHGWKVSVNGKYLYYDGVIHFPNTWGQRGFITMAPEGGVASLPALAEDPSP